MSHNLEYLLSRPGALKIATIIFGVIAAILNAHSYGSSPYTNFYEDYVQPKNNTLWNLPGTELELANMTITFIILGVSITYLAAHSFFYAMLESRLNKFIDVAFHICGALFLFSCGFSLVYSAIYIEKKGCLHFVEIPSGPIPKNSFVHPLAPFRASPLHNIFASAFPFDKLRAEKNSETKKIMCHHFGEKIVGGSLNALNGILYGFLAVIIHSADLEEF